MKRLDIIVMEPSSDIRLRTGRTAETDTPRSLPSLIPSRRKSGSRSPPSGRASPETPPTETGCEMGPLSLDEQWQQDFLLHQQTGNPSQPLAKVNQTKRQLKIVNFETFQVKIIFFLSE